jgi:hypothetical protein
VISFNESGAFEEILRRVSADAQFRENGEVGAARLGLTRHLQDARGIAVKIAYGWIELGEGNFHRT